jgi:phenylacetate-coenzyme A ligase PaaK-like adenylate-forming protein
VRPAIKNEIQSSTQKWKYTQQYDTYSQNILNKALNKIAIYRGWKQLDPGSNFPIDLRFDSLPALTKKDIREHSTRDLLPEGTDLYGKISSGEIALVATSGSTDDKIVNIWNQKWWDASERSSWKLNSFLSRIATGDHKEAILVNPKNVGIISDEVDLPFETRRLSRFLYLNEKTDPTSWTADLMDRMIEELNIFQPAVLEANPSYLARLCRYITEHNKSVFQPGIIVFTYEYPAFFHYRHIRKVFQAPIASSYGTTETGYVFMQCEEGKFHQNSDFCRVDFQPFKIEQGGPNLGRILVTPFNNPWNYLIRFDTGDIVRLEESGQCPCGRNSGIILSSVNGRTANLTLTYAGRLVTLFELDSILSAIEDIDSYQLVQPEPGTYQLVVETRNIDKDSLDRRISRALKTLYGDEAKIIIAYQNDIAPETSGKYLLSRALFPLTLDDYLDKSPCAEKTELEL